MHSYPHKRRPFSVPSQLLVQPGIGGQAGVPKPLNRIPPDLAVGPQFAAKQLFRQLGTELEGGTYIAVVVFGKLDAGKSLVETVIRLLVAQLFRVAYDVAAVGTRGDGGLDMRLSDIAVVTAN